MRVVKKAFVEASLNIIRPNVSQLIVVNRKQQMKSAFVFVAKEIFDVFQRLIVQWLMEKPYQLPYRFMDKHQISQRNFNSSLRVNLARGKFDLRFYVSVFQHAQLQISSLCSRHEQTPAPVAIKSASFGELA